MPMKSPAQHRLMEGVAHNPEFARKVGISQKVGKDFVAAGDAFSGGGLVNKNYMGKPESYAAGGPVLGRTKDFMKEPDRFRTSGAPGRAGPVPEPTEDVFGKGSKEGKNAAPAAPKDKCLPTVKPRS